MSDTLLNFGLQTQPDPIQASPPSGPPSTANLTIVVSRGGKGVLHCTSFSFSFPVGNAAKDFSNDLTGTGTTKPAGWNLALEDNVFTATPTNSPWPIGKDGLVFQFTGMNVNDQPGAAPLTIWQTTTEGGMETTSLMLYKFPPNFLLSPLTAYPVNLAPGESTILSWTGTASASYELQYEDSDGNLVTIPDAGMPPLPSVGTYSIANLQNTTTITLIATYQDGQGTATVQRQVTVTMVPLSLFVEVLPPVVGVSGVTRFSWNTTQATSCILTVVAPNGAAGPTPWPSLTLAPGEYPVPVNGSLYQILTVTTIFLLTAYCGELSKQQSGQIVVDPTIVATATNDQSGANGSGTGGKNILIQACLDPSPTPTTVWLLTSNGGSGPSGSPGHMICGDGFCHMFGGSPGGTGGNGGAIEIQVATSGLPVAAFLIAPPTGGAGGSGSGDGSPGSAGTIVIGDLPGQ